MKLKFGMVGGGNHGYIGDVHRLGATHDGKCELVAGCFTRNADKNRETAYTWGVTEQSRVYDTYQIMAEQEAKRKDKIDFVTIATPNDTHYPIAKCFLEHGIHVVCDKPLAFTLSEAQELEELAAQKKLLFCVTYTYAGYPMVQQAREMIARGELGEITTVMAEYPQEWLAVQVGTGASGRAAWRSDPERVGPSGCVGDIGTHLEFLIRYMTGLKTKRLAAHLDHIPYDFPRDTNAHILAEYENGASGCLWMSQIAFGNECAIKIRIFGTKGSVEWCHLQPYQLKVTGLDQPCRYLTANRSWLYDEARSMSRLPAGNLEGMYEAFANIYRNFAQHLIALKRNETLAGYSYPAVSDGVAGVRFIDACLKSAAQDSAWVDV